MHGPWLDIAGEIFVKPDGIGLILDVEHSIEMNEAMGIEGVLLVCMAIGLVVSLWLRGGMSANWTICITRVCGIVSTGVLCVYVLLSWRRYPWLVHWFTPCQASRSLTPTTSVTVVIEITASSR